MSSIRVANEIATKLHEIAGLLTIREKRPVAVGEAVAWIFDQLPEDYLETLKKQVLYPPAHRSNPPDAGPRNPAHPESAPGNGLPTRIGGHYTLPVPGVAPGAPGGTPPGVKVIL